MDREKVFELIRGEKGQKGNREEVKKDITIDFIVREMISEAVNLRVEEIMQNLKDWEIRSILRNIPFYQDKFKMIKDHPEWIGALRRDPNGDIIKAEDLDQIEAQYKEMGDDS